MKKVILLISIFTMSLIGYSQGIVVTNPTQEFQEALRFIDQKAAWASEKANQLQMITTLREQLQKADTIRRNVENTYKLSQKVYDEGKRLGSIADAGIPGLVYGMQVVVGMPLDPSYYIPRVGTKSEQLRSVLKYNAGAEISSDARIVYKDFLKYDPNAGDSAMTRFTKSGYELINAVNAFGLYRKDKEIDNTLIKLQQAQRMDSLANVMYRQISKDDNLSMSDADRIAMLIQVLDLKEKAGLLEMQALKEMEEQMMTRVSNPQYARKCINKAIKWKIDNEFFKAQKYSNKGVRFSLADREKSNPGGWSLSY